MGSFSMIHWVIVLIVVMLLFGAGRVSDIGKGLGEGIRNFKKGLKDEDEPPVADKKPVVREKDEEPKPAPKQLASAKKKVVEIEIGDDDTDEEIARKIAAKRRAERGDDESA
jgi:sec-independent protein translocase protein TatA